MLSVEQAPVANPAVPCAVLLRDDALLAVEKPAGTVTLPGLGHANDSLLNGAFAVDGSALTSLGAQRDWGLLHRLDRETSGVVLIARTAAAYDSLRAQFEARSVAKAYLAIVKGRLPGTHGICQEPLAEVRRGDLKISVPQRGGLAAVTHWRVVAAASGSALVACAIETGRLHQIRAHLAWLGAPVEGDRVYRALLPPNTSAARGVPNAPPLLLHAWRIGFLHPLQRKRVDVESPLPETILAAAAHCAGVGSNAAGRAHLEQLLAPLRSDWWGKPAATNSAKASPRKNRT
ncbi:MAG: RluA family pseudouridine synthase [Planctomycetes bacterium]|nr:RluA family pseudouridine synthase [Planctomycetota bacterium]